jgi:hypothetical protein
VPCFSETCFNIVRQYMSVFPSGLFHSGQTSHFIRRSELEAGIPNMKVEGPLNYCDTNRSHTNQFIRLRPLEVPWHTLLYLVTAECEPSLRSRCLLDIICVNMLWPRRIHLHWTEDSEVVIDPADTMYETRNICKLTILKMFKI